MSPLATAMAPANLSMSMNVTALNRFLPAVGLFKIKNQILKKLKKLKR